MSVKPELVSYDFGRHNVDLEKSTKRVLESGSWRKQNVAMIIPASTLVPAKCALAWMNLVFPPNNGVVRILTQGMEIGEAYNEAIKSLLKNVPDFQYVLTVEHDNVPPPDGILKLAAYMDQYPQYAAISGLYWTKGEIGHPQIWGDVSDPVVNFRPQPPRGEIQECYGIGMGFALWRLDMFKDEKLVKPWFKTVVNGDGFGTQDLYFWRNARPLGYRCAVANTVRVGHFDHKTGITW